ncbi:hypothetical protein [Methanosarcina sp. UBA5]|uniref:hypothetical protein n=1 Tax=Methanosarcina sp. UBA5 TaxID=1915593 RepID=UPI0025DE8489|nr:hypothetical protein [Methanosarcina sp. UBA5]
MKTKPIIAIALLISAVLLAARVVPGTSADQFKEGKYIHVDNIVIQFDKTDATVNIDYHLSPFAQAYISLFGSKNLEPKIKEIFSEFHEVQIQNIGRSSASLQILNVSREEDGNYLCDPYELGVQSDVVTFVYPPKGTKKSYENVKVTPPVFYVLNEKT